MHVPYELVLQSADCSNACGAEALIQIKHVHFSVSYQWAISIAMVVNGQVGMGLYVSHRTRWKDQQN